MIRLFWTGVFTFIAFPSLAFAGDVPAIFQPGECGASKLDIVQNYPVVTLSGTPKELGQAQGVLLGKASKALFRFFLTPAATMSGGVDQLMARAMKMDAHIPQRFKDEMQAMAESGGLEYNKIVTGNAFPDVYRWGGCSTLAVAAPVTHSGKPLLARNLDFFSMGVLDKDGLVAVFKPTDYHAFLSVTWPGFNGVLSGMNEKGLCCAVMEVRTGQARSDGMPSVFLFRRVMEEASNVEEALAILKGAVKVSSNNLTLLDASGAAAVAELGPERFVVRRMSQGALFSTNDHRGGIDPAPPCRRYQSLERFCKKQTGKVDATLLQKVLNEVNQGIITVQSMIFEPEALRLHLAMGRLPASEGEFKIFDFDTALRTRQGHGIGAEKDKVSDRNR